MASDGNNVITTTTTSDDAECGGKFMILVDKDFFDKRKEDDK